MLAQFGIIYTVLKSEKHPWRSVTFSKVQASFHFYTPWKHQKTSGFLIFSRGIEVEACNFTISNTPKWVFFNFKLHKWCQIAQRVASNENIRQISWTDVYSEPCQTSNIEIFREKQLLAFRLLLFCKKLHLRLCTGFWICFSWKFSKLTTKTPQWPKTDIFMVSLKATSATKLIFAIK